MDGDPPELWRALGDDDWQMIRTTGLAMAVTAGGEIAVIDRASVTSIGRTPGQALFNLHRTA